MPTPPDVFGWEDHHFVAGSPALDFANAVVFRPDPMRREDRFRHPGDVNAWVAAAGLEVAPIVEADMRDVIAVREAIDAFFRQGEGNAKAGAWERLVRQYGRHVAGLAAEPHPSLLAFILDQALALHYSPWRVRVKACGGCGWLFVDRTRNGSRRWCISAMCGSRDKARRYYHRKKARQAPTRPA
jgi:predicted RNA-binding Zn ribbon-like protein